MWALARLETGAGLHFPEFSRANKDTWCSELHFPQHMAPTTFSRFPKALLHFPSSRSGLGAEGDKVAGKGLRVIAPFFPLSVYARFAGLPTAKCWDRAFGDSQPLWSVGATMRKVRGRLVCKGPGFVGVGALGCDSLSAVERWVVSPEFGLGRRLAFRFRQRESSGPWVRP